MLGKWSHVPFLISVLVTWRVVHAWSRRESPKLCHGNPTLFCEDPEFCYLPNQCVCLPFYEREIHKAYLKKQLKAYPIGFDELRFCSMFELGVAVNQAGS